MKYFEMNEIIFLIKNWLMIQIRKPVLFALEHRADSAALHHIGQSKQLVLELVS